MNWLKKVFDNATGLVDNESSMAPAPRIGGPIMETPKGSELELEPPSAEPGAAPELETVGVRAAATACPEAEPAGSEELRRLAAELRDSVASARPRLEEIERELKQVAARQEELQQIFESRISSDEFQSKALEKLHDQLEGYKANFVREEMKPLLRDLTFCYDFAAEELEGARASAGNGATPAGHARAFEHLLQMIADMLAKYDIEPFRGEGDGFDLKTQQCVRTVPTGIEANHKKIAAVGSVGFRSSDLILRKEQVTVYKYTQGFTAEPAASRFEPESP